MTLKDILHGSDGNQPPNNPTPSNSEQERDEERKKREEAVKAETWLKIGVAVLIIGIAIFLVISVALVISEVVSPVVLGWMVLAIIAFFAVWELLLGIHSVPTREEWIIEARSNFWKVQTQSPLILPLPLMITKVAQRISLKEITDSGLFKDEQLELKDTKISVKAIMTYRISNSYRAYYNIEPSEGEEWSQTLLKLVRSTAQDALQTCVSEEGPNNEPYDTDTIVRLRGSNLADRIFQSETKEHVELYAGFRKNLERWGIKIVTLIFKDFERSEDDEKERREVYKQRKAKTRAEIGVGIGEMEGRAIAKKTGTASWELAKDYAGIKKKDEDLTESEIKEIAVFVPAARSDYLESLSVEGSIKSPDRTVILQGDSVGKVMGRDVAREAVRQEMSRERKKKGKKPEDQKEPKEQKEKEKQKED